MIKNSKLLSTGIDGKIELLFSGINKIMIKDVINKYLGLISFFTTKIIIMKNMKIILEKFYLPLTILFNFYLFLITYIQYSSHRGTDFDIYGNYLNYFIFGIQGSLEEQTVGYFSLVSKISTFSIDTIKISVDYKELIYNHGIQITNYLLFIIGLVGIYKLLMYLDINKFHSLTIINLLSVFPPLLGLRMILKPEIMAFAFLPWLIYLIVLYNKTYQKKYLFLLLPIIGLLISLKSSISLMVGFIILIFFGKTVLRKEILLLGAGSLAILSLLVFESYQVTNILIWDHKTPAGYNFKAPLSFLYNLNTEIWTNPFRDSQATSMWGILILDTFGDYWERYWFHADGYLVENNHNKKLLINISSIISVAFYSISIFYLIKDKDKFLKKIGILGYVGLFVMIVNSHNLVPFLTKNFNPVKGDPMKTHYFSFLLAFTFIYIYLKIFQDKKNIYSIIFLMFMTIFSIQLLKPIGINQIKSEQSLINKVHLLSPCTLGDPAGRIISYSHSWCNEESIINAICEGDYDKSLTPVDKGGYFVFPPDESYRSINLIKDENVITVNNYFECLNYAEGGFLPQPAGEYFFNVEKKSPYIFNFVFLLSCLATVSLINTSVKNEP